jgi:hypothetical protein
LWVYLDTIYSNNFVLRRRVNMDTFYMGHRFKLGDSRVIMEHVLFLVSCLHRNNASDYHNSYRYHQHHLPNRYNLEWD